MCIWILLDTWATHLQTSLVCTTFVPWHHVRLYHTHEIQKIHHAVFIIGYGSSLDLRSSSWVFFSSQWASWHLLLLLLLLWFQRRIEKQRKDDRCLIPSFSVSFPARRCKNLSFVRFPSESSTVFPRIMPPRPSRPLTNVGKYQNGTSYTRVSARHLWTRLAPFGTLDSRQQGKIDVVRWPSLKRQCKMVKRNQLFLRDIMKGGTQGFPRHEVSDKQEVLFEDVSPSTALERLGESGARVRTGLPWVRSEPNPMDHKRG